MRNVFRKTREPAPPRGGGAVMVLPTLLFLMVFALVPFLILLAFSCLSLNLADAGTFHTFVGLDHYRALLQSDSGFTAAVSRTVQFTAIGVFFETGFGVLLAIVLHSLHDRVKSVVTSVAIIPMMMAPVAV